MHIEAIVIVLQHSLSGRSHDVGREAPPRGWLDAYLSQTLQITTFSPIWSLNSVVIRNVWLSHNRHPLMQADLAL